MTPSDSSYRIAPRLALVAGVGLAVLPRLAAGAASAELRWLAIGVVAALGVIALTRFAARDTGAPAPAAIGDAVALGALALAFPSPAIAALAVVAIVVHARRGAPMLALVASVLGYAAAVLVRLVGGALPAGAGADAIGAAVLIVVAGIAVLAATPAAEDEAREAKARASSPGLVSLARESEEAVAISQTLGGAVSELDEIGRTFSTTLEDLEVELERQRSFTHDGTR
ncbi:MAG TPA: hypothetical protein VFS59_05815, partial [Gemmatimonadaceae bacterium]|nr:hypothetical protein [Gemmatimonadaceae bacterium]